MVGMPQTKKTKKMPRKKSAAKRSAAPRTRASHRPKELVFEGLAVSPGVAIGPAHIRESGEIQVPERDIKKAEIAAEQERFDKAVDKAVRQLGKLRAKASSLHGAAAEELGFLLEAHLQMVESSRLLNGVHARIEKNQINAEAAVREAGQLPRWAPPGRLAIIAVGDGRGEDRALGI